MLGRISTKVFLASLNLDRKPCKVIDVIVNPEVCESLLSDKTKAMMSFFRELLTSYIFQKHKIEVNVKNFRLPKIRYKGTIVEHQRVRGTKNPKISVMNTTKVDGSMGKRQQDEEKAKENLKNFSNEQAQDLRKPAWTLELIPSDFSKEDEDYELMEFDGFNFNLEEASGFVIKVELPLMTTGKYFNLQSSGKTIHLKCGRFYKLDLSIPLAFEKDNLTALFDIEKRQLIIRGYFVQVEQEEEEDLEEVENIIDINAKKIEEQDIKIESDLLTTIV